MFVPQDPSGGGMGGFVRRCLRLVSGTAARMVAPAGVGRWGMLEFVEPRVRHVVAEQLGVDVADLEPGVTLRDDLAADPQDLVELALRLERELGVVVSDRVVADVRSYGDLVDATVRLLLTHRRRVARRHPTITVRRDECAVEALKETA
jgi:acyl carrier protein